MKVTTLGIDLAKSIFQLHGVNEHGFCRNFSLDGDSAMLLASS